jgi:hypothetical protein
MVSPANGATNVSAAISELVFRNSPDPFSITLQGSDGTQVFSSPSANQSDGTTSVSIPQLSAHTMYTIAVIEPGPCRVYGGSSGSFTTQ